MSFITNMEPIEPDDVLMFELPKVKDPCINCGLPNPVNTQGLCYRCYVIIEIKSVEPDWLPGDEHPLWCHCMLPEHFSNNEQRLNRCLN